MKMIHVASPFSLNLGKTVVNVSAGIQQVEDEIADHWFTKAHLADGGLGAESYATAARAGADNAFVKAKEAVALYIGMEKACGDAEKAAGVDLTEPAFSRIGGMPDPKAADMETGGIVGAAAESVAASGAVEGDAKIDDVDPKAAPTLDDMTDQELRDFIKTRDGKMPHPATSRDKLLAAAKGDEATSAEIEAESGDKESGAEKTAGAPAAPAQAAAPAQPAAPQPKA